MLFRSWWRFGRSDVRFRRRRRRLRRRRRWRRLRVWQRRRKVRDTYLATHPLCVFCGAVATRVAHVDGTDYETERYDWDKLRALCKPCHDQRTTAQGNAAQGRGQG